MMKRRSSLLFPWLLVWVLPMGFAAAGAADFDPSEYRWKQRPVFIYAPAGAEAQLAAQKKLWRDEKAGLEERDMVIIIWEGRDALPGAARERYKINPEKFTVLLVGKDGGVKLREHEPVGPERIYKLIDSMPMRQDEMKRR